MVAICSKIVVDSDFLRPPDDPETLCPWCDERLPSEPTTHLSNLIAAAKSKSRRDERLANPLGLRAPLATFSVVCQRHRFERDWIPHARQKHWPTLINFNQVPERITRLKGALGAIVEDVDEVFAPDVARLITGTSNGSRPRKENEFWQDAVKNVREHGSRQAAGVRCQFQHFNKTQPG